MVREARQLAGRMRERRKTKVRTVETQVETVEDQVLGCVHVFEQKREHSPG